MRLAIILCGLISFQVFADYEPKEEDAAIITKISGIVAKRCNREPARAETYQAYLTFLRGSPFDGINAPEAGERWKYLMSEIAKIRKYDLKIETFHHSSWRSVCESAQAMPDATLVMIGHSYGASGIAKAARCLAEDKREVDGLISISSYDFLAGIDVEEVGANVMENLNFYTNDSGIPGYKDHKAMDPEQTYVRNMLAEVNDGSWAHLNVSPKLVPLLALQTAFYVEHRAEHLKIPDQFDTEGLAGRLDDFNPCP